MIDTSLLQIRNHIDTEELKEVSRLYQVAYENNALHMLPELIERNKETFNEMRSEYRKRGMDI